VAKNQSSSASGASGSLSNRRVLIVEDEYFLADEIARELERLGAEVIGPAADRDDALALVETAGRVDAAILDIVIRGETIYDIVDALKARGIPVVFATGYDRSVVPPLYEDVPRLEKPFELRALTGCLVRLLHRPDPGAREPSP
jgi:CheY-like chemotaxis protein